MPALKFSGTMHMQGSAWQQQAYTYIGTTKEISAGMDMRQSAWIAAVVLHETAI